MTNLLSSCARLAAALLFILRRAPSWRAAACLAICACLFGNAAACPLQAPKSRFTDLAGLPGLHANLVADRLAAYQRASGHQLLVLVVPSLDGGMSIEQCAVEVFQKWKIGQKGVDDGVLLLVAVKERKMRIEVGYGLEGVLTDAQSSRIIHEVMQPLFARGEFAEGIDGGLTEIMAVIGSTRPAVPVHEQALSGADATGDAAAGRTFGAFLLLIFLVLSPLMGGVGLLVFGAMAIALAHWMYSDWRGNAVAAVWCLTWLALRWWMIHANVKKYRLGNSRYPTLTWIWCFLIAGTAGQARPARARPGGARLASADDGFSVSFDTDSDSGSDASSDSGSGSSSDSGSGSSSDSGSCSSSDSSSELSSDSGGGSGGGGASGDW